MRVVVVVAVVAAAALAGASSATRPMAKRRRSGLADIEISSSDVTYAVARAREGVGPHWGFTVMSAPGAAAGGVKPQVGH